MCSVIAHDEEMDRTSLPRGNRSKILGHSKWQIAALHSLVRVIYVDGNVSFLGRRFCLAWMAFKVPRRETYLCCWFLKRQKQGVFWECCEELEEIFLKGGWGGALRGPGVYWRTLMWRCRVSFCNAAPRCCHKSTLCQSTHESSTQTHTDAVLKANTSHLTSWVTPMSSAGLIFPKTGTRQGFFCSNLSLLSHNCIGKPRAIDGLTTPTYCSVSDRLRSVCYSSSEMEVNWQAVSLPGRIYTGREGRRLLAHSSQLTKETEVTHIA